MPSTKTAVSLWDEYRRDFEAALEPCMSCLLAKCPEGELETLHALAEAYWEQGPESPPYSPVQMRRIHERFEPVWQRVKADPAVIAMDDQRAAAWRDTPWLVKRWRRVRFRVLCVRLRLSLIGRKKRWE